MHLLTLYKTQEDKKKHDLHQPSVHRAMEGQKVGSNLRHSFCINTN